MTCKCTFDLLLPFRTLPAVFEIRPTTMPPQPCVSTGMNLEHFDIEHMSKLSERKNSILIFLNFLMFLIVSPKVSFMSVSTLPQSLVTRYSSSSRPRTQRVTRPMLEEAIALEAAIPLSCFSALLHPQILSSNYATVDPKQLHKSHMKSWGQAQSTDTASQTSWKTRWETRPETRERQDQEADTASQTRWETSWETRRQYQRGGHSIWQTSWETRPETRERQDHRAGHSIPGKADTLRKH